MKKSIAVILFLLICSTNFSQEINNKPTETVTTYYFIRHAEKDTSNTDSNNPDLSEIGKQRANNWVEILKNIDFDAVYSTDYNRTKQTANPIARSNNIETTIYDIQNFDFDKFKTNTNGQTVMIVGHSNSTPMMINVIIGNKKYQQINENNYSNLYIITRIGNNISDKLLTIN